MISLEWYWFTKIEPKLVFALGFVFAAFSIIVVVGEITIFQDYQLSLFGWVVREESSYLKTQVIDISKKSLSHLFFNFSFYA